MRTLIDAGPLVAMLDPRDQYHQWAYATAKTVDAPLYSCEAVVTEAHFLLRRRTHDGSARLNVLLSSGQIGLDFSAINHIHDIRDLMARYDDIPMSFADACLVRMAESCQAQVFTTDGGFRTYRTSSGKRMPLLIP